MQGYACEAGDARIQNSGSSKYYVNGANGQTEAVVDVTNPGIITHNIWGNDLVGLPARQSPSKSDDHDLAIFFHPPSFAEGITS